MIDIKGLLIFEEQNFFKKLKSLFGIYDTEIKTVGDKEIFILKTSSYNDTVRRRFIRRRINRLAFIPECEENKTLLKGEGFNLILKKNLIRNKLTDIIKKYAGTWGIKKGKLTVGLATDDATMLLNKLSDISDWLSGIYLYGKKTGRSIYAADEFFKQTGIAVILSDKQSDYECDFLVVENKESVNCKKFGGAVLFLCEPPVLNGVKVIKDVRLNIPKEAETEGCDDIILDELFDFNGKINKLIIEK